MWSTVVGLFKFSREESALTLVLFIIFVIYLIYKSVLVVQWQVHALVILMTWVQAPASVLSFFKIYFYFIFVNS